MKILLHKIYDYATWIWHKIFHAPIRLAIAYDNKVSCPTLTVIFLHGISATSQTWSTTIRQLSRNSAFQKVRFIALDLLGFGKSLHASWLDYDYHDYEQALDNTIKKLKITTPIVLVGHSMGALIAAKYANDHMSNGRVIHLILVSPPVLMPEELARLPDQVYVKSYSSLSRIAVDVPAAEVIAKIAQRFSSFRSDYIKTAAFAKSMEQVILNSQNFATFTKIRLPTLLLHGHFDPLVMGSNLRQVAKQNSTYLHYQSVIGHHDISIGKRTKIEQELKKVVKNAIKN